MQGENNLQFKSLMGYALHWEVCRACQLSNVLILNSAHAVWSETQMLLAPLVTRTHQCASFVARLLGTSLTRVCGIPARRCPSEAGIPGASCNEDGEAHRDASKAYPGTGPFPNSCRLPEETQEPCALRQNLRPHELDVSAGADREQDHG